MIMVFLSQFANYTNFVIQSAFKFQKRMSIYPASPVSVPDDLLKLPARYHYKVWLAIFAIILFFVLYAFLVYATAWLFYEAVMMNIEISGFYALLFYAGAILGSLMLFIFTLKFAFKLKSRKPKNRLKLAGKEYQAFFAFVDKICEETKAPRPRNIYIDPDVNAYVSYTNQMASLALPAGKELTVGMGLISCLNLNEFKAVIAHEFGHFSQRSMKVGSYINSANTIIHDMIFTRDKWDETLARWRTVDLRLSFAAWIITPVIWLIRQLLLLFYQMLNLLHSGLSREMEFNADKVAVSVSGSDAIVSALWKLQGGQTKLNESLNFAFRAAQSSRFTDNIFRFHRRAMKEQFRENEKEFMQLSEHPRGGKHFFKNDKGQPVGMYSSHPSDRDREENAKKPYVPCSPDEREVWVLFEDTDKIQQQISKIVYTEYFGKKPGVPVSDEEFLHFMEEEKSEKEAMAAFGNNFDQRFVEIPETDTDTAGEYTAEEIREKAGGLMRNLQDLMAPVKEIDANIEKVQEMAAGSKTLKTFKYKGKIYGRKEAQAIYEILMKEKQDWFNNSFGNWDQAFFSFYITLSKMNNTYPELKALMDQHKVLQGIVRNIMGLFNYVVQNINLVGYASGDGDPSGVEAFRTYRINITDALREINTSLAGLSEINFIPLSNIPDLNTLRNSIAEGGTVKYKPTELFNQKGIIELANQLQVIAGNCNWVDQKSVLTIVRLIINTGKSFGLEYLPVQASDTTAINQAGARPPQ